MSRGGEVRRASARHGRHAVGRTAAAAIALALALVTGACGGDSPDAGSASAGENAETETTAEPSTTTTTAPYGGWPVQTAPDGAYSMALRHGWQLTTLEGDPAEIAARLVTGAPFDATAIDVVVRWQEGGAHSAATGDWGPQGPFDDPFLEPHDSVVVSLLPEGVTAQAVVDYYRQTPPYTETFVDAVEEVEGASRRITRIGITAGYPVLPEGYIYLVEDGARLWELTMITRTSDRSQGLSDRIALSFTPSSSST
jgi:hypothetical protein